MKRVSLQSKLSHLLERCYAAMPLPVQNLGISAYGLAYRHERLGKHFDGAVKEFSSRDHVSAAEMQSFVESRLREVLVHALAYVPYYQRAWKKAAYSAEDFAKFRVADLAHLPIVPKQDLREKPEDFVATDVSAHTRLHRYYTSGSTGTPITCYLSSKAHRHFFAAREARSFQWAGVSIKEPRSTIGGRRIVSGAGAGPPYYRYNMAERQVYLSAYHISAQNLDSYVEGFNRYRPKVLTGYAYSHFALAQLMLEKGMKLDYKPDALLLGSESLTPEMKVILHEAFQARAYEEYGTAEQCVLATECASGNLHVNTDFGIVEIVDDHGRVLPDGREGRIICTALLNDAQPLIRYDLGDIGALSTETCACGRDQLPVLKGLLGRLEDAVRGPGGIELVRFHSVFIGVPHLLQAQVIQEGLNRLRINVVVNGDFGENEERLILERVNGLLGPIEVKIDRVSDLERDGRGKVRAVISRISKPNLDSTFPS